MPNTAKATEFDRGPFRRLSDSEILLFLARTLQPQIDGGEWPTVVAKLQHRGFGRRGGKTFRRGAGRIAVIPRR